MCPHCGQAPCVCPAMYQVHSGMGLGKATMQQQPNKLTILSWNLQNYTHDPRQNFRRSMHVPRAEMTAAFVAATMVAQRADMLLIMETGSDASLALYMIDGYRQRFGGPPSDPLVTDLTHATPEFRNRSEISVLSPAYEDVHALKNLLDVYTVEDVDLELAAGAVQAAWNLYLQCRPHVPVAVQLTGDNNADSDLLLNACAGALTNFNERFPSPASRDAIVLAYNVFKAQQGSIGAAARAMLDLRAQYRAQQVSAELLWTMEAFAFARLLRAIHLDQLAIGELGANVTPHQDDRIPAVICLLSIKYPIVVSVADVSAVTTLQDPSFVYRALEHFQIITVGAEAYAILCTLSQAQRELLFLEGQLQEIVRLDANGNLLDTQQPGGYANHRSAMRMALPLPGGRFAEIILFHTRFTPPAALKKQKNVAAKTIQMRCDSIEAIALIDQPPRHAGIPRLLFGDFNLPANDNRTELTTFASTMTALGYTRNPSAQPYPATTLKASRTILLGAPDVYNEPYDAVFTQNMTAAQVVSCTALKIIDDMIDHLSFDASVRDAMQGYAGMVYERLIDKLDKKIAEQAGEVATAQLLNRNPTTAVMPPFAPAKGELEACSDAFGSRSLADDTALARPLFAQFIADVGVQLLQAQTDGSGRAIKALTIIQTLAAETETSMNNLETVRAVRIHAAYRYGVSDHVPIRIEIDLDK